MRSKIGEYKAVYKRAGWKGLAKELGPKAAILLFLFFLIKGLVWLAVLFGGYEALS
ncbi:hypothetical protein [Phaeocystidibacter marisrubri]|uniref:hypothetical protein n=1 Tax=Phaeocystidibacter marisrubri TaxID=1577780 RepID=UPI0014789B19|nr:hypothetical protein [Phaeocystidibacter marisrubri]